MKSRFRHFLSCMIFVSATSGFANNSTNIGSIVGATFSALPNCLHYKIVGACFWLMCTPLGCSVNTTMKVEHYLPDVIVSVYPKYGSDPWAIVNKSIDVADHAAGNSLFQAANSGLSIHGGFANNQANHNSSVQFREVDVVGNPALYALHLKYFLNGQATPFEPYYQSQLDANEWRSGLLEQLYPDTWLPGKDVIGHFLTDDWGSLYPRDGFILQANVAKASAVIALRGANIATAGSFDHIAKNLASAPCRDEACEAPGEITTDPLKVEWQMLLPNQASSCQPTIAAKANPVWTKGQSDNQTYSWIVWREYVGCLQGEGLYLGSVGG